MSRPRPGDRRSRPVGRSRWLPAPVQLSGRRVGSRRGMAVQPAGAKMRSPVLAGHPVGVRTDDRGRDVFARQMCTICPPAARGRPPCSLRVRSSLPCWRRRRHWPARYCRTGPASSSCGSCRRFVPCSPTCAGLGLLVIDGYADLDPAGRPGLGAHAHAAFGVPVIGVAKSRFRTASHAVQVLRGVQPGRCSPPRPGCRRPRPPAWSAVWPARSGSRTHCAGPTPSPVQDNITRSQPGPEADDSSAHAGAITIPLSAAKRAFEPSRRCKDIQSS
jgi:hypothetical protein